MPPRARSAALFVTNCGDLANQAAISGAHCVVTMTNAAHVAGGVTWRTGDDLRRPPPTGAAPIGRGCRDWQNPSQTPVTGCEQGVVPRSAGILNRSMFTGKSSTKRPRTRSLLVITQVAQAKSVGILSGLTAEMEFL